jgi:hypothetical protein
LVFPVSFEGPPHFVASYDTQGGVEDLFLPESSRGTTHKRVSSPEDFTSISKLYLFHTFKQSSASMLYVIFFIPSHSLGTMYINSTGLLLRPEK